MGHTGNRIFDPVSILGDLRPVIPTSLKTLEDICTSAPINKWSFRKSVRHSTKANITNAQIADSHCGLAPVPVTKILRSSIGWTGGTYNYTKAEGLAEIAEWAYNRPRGKNYSEPFRTRDFNGYNGDAIAPDAGWSTRVLSTTELTKMGQVYMEVKNTGTYTGTNFKLIPKENSSDSDSNPYNSLLYSGFRMRLDVQSGASIGDVTNMDIPIRYIAPLTEDWRLVLAVWIPNFGSAGGWGLFCGRMTINQGISEAGAGTGLMTVYPDFATNQFAGRLMQSYANAQGGFTFDAVPLLVKNLRWKKEEVGGHPDTFYVYCVEDDTEAYCMPSGQLAVSVQAASGSVIVYYQIIYTPQSGAVTGAIKNLDVSQHSFTYEVYQNGSLSSSGTVTLQGGETRTVGGAPSGVNLTIVVTAQDGQPV